MTSINRENATCQLLNERYNALATTTTTKYEVGLGHQGHRPCPFTFCYAVDGCERVASEYMVTRQCNLDGTWADSIYTECIDLLRTHQQCIVGFCRTCPDPLRDTVISVSLMLSVISVGVLLAALILFSIFDSIQCRRLSIHKNLAAAFVLRFAVLAIWTITSTSNFFRDCTHFNPMPLRNLEWLCKGLLWLVIYFQVASVMWMLIEGLYLYSRFTVLAMRQSELPYAIYLLAGWGTPLFVVSIWSLVHQTKSNTDQRSFCWLPYAQGAHLWILAGTMGIALVLNVCLLLAIVVILVQKLRTESSAESKKIWRTVKATVLLVPLLGVSNIPLFYEPDKPGAIYMLSSAILQHSQGIFIAVLYCFLNGEIQCAVKRQLSKVPFQWFHSTSFPRFETERTYLHEPGVRGSRPSKLGMVPLDEMNSGSCASRHSLIQPGQRSATATNISNNAAHDTSTTSPLRTAHVRADERTETDRPLMGGVGEGYASTLPGGEGYLNNYDLARHAIIAHEQTHEL